MLVAFKTAGVRMDPTLRGRMIAKHEGLEADVSSVPADEEDDEDDDEEEDEEDEAANRSQ
jgi:hypothetical protein